MKGCEESRGRRKSCAKEKRPMLAEPAKIRHFPLAPIFCRLGARTAHPQGRSAQRRTRSVARAGCRQRIKRDRGSRRRHAVCDF
jgi:hypothetical protein